LLEPRIILLNQLTPIFAEDVPTNVEIACLAAY
jgi:hypothetical protein